MTLYFGPGKIGNRRKEGSKGKEVRSTDRKVRKGGRRGERREPTPIKTKIKRLKKGIKERSMEGKIWRKKKGKETENRKETPGKIKKQPLQTKRDLYLRNIEGSKEKA